MGTGGLSAHRVSRLRPSGLRTSTTARRVPRHSARRRRSDGRRSARQRRRGAETNAGEPQGRVRRHGNECRTTSGAQQPQCPHARHPAPTPPTATRPLDHTTRSQPPPEHRPRSPREREGVRLTGSRGSGLAAFAPRPPHAGVPRRTARRRRSEGRRSARQRRRGAAANLGNGRAESGDTATSAERRPARSSRSAPPRAAPRTHTPPTVSTPPGSHQPAVSTRPSPVRGVARYRESVRLTGSRRRSLALAGRPPVAAGGLPAHRVSRLRPSGLRTSTTAHRDAARHGGGGATGCVRHVDGGVAPTRTPGHRRAESGDTATSAERRPARSSRSAHHARHPAPTPTPQSPPRPDHTGPQSAPTPSPVRGVARYRESVRLTGSRGSGPAAFAPRPAPRAGRP